jgi:hypothetical protein
MTEERFAENYVALAGEIKRLKGKIASLDGDMIRLANDLIGTGKSLLAYRTDIEWESLTKAVQSLGKIVPELEEDKNNLADKEQRLSQMGEGL